MAPSRLDIEIQDGLKATTKGTASSNYLGDPQLVDRLVRDFFSVVISERAKFHETGDGDAAEQRIAELCTSYARMFMGESDHYVAQPWNSPHRLGNYLRAVTPDVADYPTPAEAYFNVLAVQALSASVAIEEGIVSEAEAQGELTAVVNDAVNVLLGRKAGV